MTLKEFREKTKGLPGDFEIVVDDFLEFKLADIQKIIIDKTLERVIIEL